MPADPVEGMARVGWASIYEMIDDHREHAAKTEDAEIAAMLLKDAATFEADVLKRARAAWAYALAALWQPGPANDAIDRACGQERPFGLIIARKFLATFASERGLETPDAD